MIGHKGGESEPPLEVRTTALKPGIEELAKVGSRFELWNGIELLECASERIRQAPLRLGIGDLQAAKCSNACRRAPEPTENVQIVG